jgi:hypothetical protein
MFVNAVKQWLKLCTSVHAKCFVPLQYLCSVYPWCSDAGVLKKFYGLAKLSRLSLDERGWLTQFSDYCKTPASLSASVLFGCQCMTVAVSAMSDTCCVCLVCHWCLSAVASSMSDGRCIAYVWQLLCRQCLLVVVSTIICQMLCRLSVQLLCSLSFAMESTSSNFCVVNFCQLLCRQSLPIAVSSMSSSFVSPMSNMCCVVTFTIASS